MAKGKKRALAAPPHADSDKDRHKQHPGTERDDFSLEAQMNTDLLTDDLKKRAPVTRVSG